MTGNLSLERGLAVLDLLKDTDEPIGVRDLGRRLDQSAAAVQRILNTLAEYGYVEQVTESRRYRLGHSVLALARYILRKDRLIGLAETELQALAAEGCFNAFLAVRRGDRGLYLLTVQSKSPVIIRSSPGETFPLHSTALGKALLMELSAEAVIGILGQGPLERLTPRTVTETSKLIAQITGSESVGYTTSLDENFAGLIAVGAPVRDASGAIIAGVSVAYPRSVGPHVEIAEIGEAVMAAATRISVSLGYRGAISHPAGGPSHAA
ncbi:IclR family transcriptional regulator [Mesorhizobium sp. CO1-1-4]|uniref:IclR family transcriptional regulator n=1 Tax=Mesorhizobium sp. CO1-1-4 TaxID=2876633 RepID=UPI001CCC3498|nr:IclR family transcriptional regulator [Mesorhizobium sp. CO1-1-4]MBZ9740630.1 IclR family transcriptional regulator [Mesorhizobium sp. CO1-1-4]